MFFKEDESNQSAEPSLGAVRLMLDAQPWRIVVSMRGLKISSHSLVTLLRPSEDDLLTIHDLAHELREGTQYRLQIEYEDMNLAQPFVGAELVEKRLTRSGLELGFSFDTDEPPEEPIFQY